MRLLLSCEWQTFTKFKIENLDQKLKLTSKFNSKTQKFIFGQNEKLKNSKTQQSKIVKWVNNSKTHQYKRLKTQKLKNSLSTITHFQTLKKLEMLWVFDSKSSKTHKTCEKCSYLSEKMKFFFSAARKTQKLKTH